MPATQRPRVVTFAQAAKLIGISPSAVSNAISDGRLPTVVVKMPRRMIRVRDLREYEKKTDRRRKAQKNGAMK